MLRVLYKFAFDPFSTEPVLQITWVHSYAITCWTKQAMHVTFSTMNRQDGHLQIDPKENNLSSYAHGQLRVEKAKLAIA
jgi:hypothetical protein